MEPSCENLSLPRFASISTRVPCVLWRNDCGFNRLGLQLFQTLIEPDRGSASLLDQEPRSTMQKSIDGFCRDSQLL